MRYFSCDFYRDHGVTLLIRYPTVRGYSHHMNHEDIMQLLQYYRQLRQCVTNENEIGYS